jgi:hypothetical protein
MTRQNLNAKILDFGYCSTSRTKQVLHQSNNNCFVTEAFLLDLKTLANDSFFPSGPKDLK